MMEEKNNLAEQKEIAELIGKFQDSVAELNAVNKNIGELNGALKTFIKDIKPLIADTKKLNKIMADSQGAIDFMKSIPKTVKDLDKKVKESKITISEVKGFLESLENGEYGAWFKEATDSITEIEENNERLTSTINKQLEERLTKLEKSINKQFEDSLKRMEKNFQKKLKKLDMLQAVHEQKVSPVNNETAKNAEEARKKCEKGIALYEAQEYEKAVKKFKEAAAMDNAEAQYRLGCCYYDGKGAAQDYDAAFELFSRAAVRLVDMRLQFMLGECYFYGRGISKNYKQAVKWYRQAADWGQSRAQYRLGYCYYEGKGVNKNSDLARRWLEKAAKDDEEAEKLLREIEARG